MKEKWKKTIDIIIAIFVYGILLPFVLLALIAKGVDICMEYLFDKIFKLYHKICKIVRGLISNSVVYVMGKEYKLWHRINVKLLTIKEAKELGKEYEDEGYEVYLSLSEF